MNYQSENYLTLIKKKPLTSFVSLQKKKVTSSANRNGYKLSYLFVLVNKSILVSGF